MPIQRMFAAMIVTSMLALASQAQDKPKGAFARGEKLPGDLSNLLDGDADGQISDAEVNKAIDEFQKQGNDKTDRGKAILSALDNNKDGKVDKAEAEAGAVQGRLQGGGNGQVVEAIFKKLDADSNGFVTEVEYGKLALLVGLFDREAGGKLVQLFRQIDTNSDRAISFVESQLVADMFAQQGGLPGARAGAAAPAKNPRVQAFVDAMFAKRDKNKDGQISTSEARRDVALYREFNAADGNGDKNLTADELYQYLEAKFNRGR